MNQSRGHGSQASLSSADMPELRSYLLSLGALGVAVAAAVCAQRGLDELPVTLVAGTFTFVGVRALLELVFLIHS